MCSVQEVKRILLQLIGLPDMPWWVILWLSLDLACFFYCNYVVLYRRYELFITYATIFNFLCAIRRLHFCKSKYQTAWKSSLQSTTLCFQRCGLCPSHLFVKWLVSAFKHTKRVLSSKQKSRINLFLLTYVLMSTVGNYVTLHLQ